MTSPDEEQRFIQDFLDQHPEAKALMDQRKAEEQERQRVFDAMDILELRDAAATALISAANVIASPDSTVLASEDDWTAENRQNLANHLLKMAEKIDDDVDPRSSFNMAKRFDFFPIEDELETVAYEAVAAYRAYLRRRVSP